MQSQRLINRRLDNKSRVNGDVYARFCENLGLKCPGLLDNNPWKTACLHNSKGRLIKAFKLHRYSCSLNAFFCERARKARLHRKLEIAWKNGYAFIF